MNKVLALVCLLAAASISQAATVCRIVSAGGVAFGSYDVLAGTPTDSLLNIGVVCDRNGGAPGVTVDIGLGAGIYGASESARRMQLAGGPGYYLSYGLFSDAGRSRVWGSSSGINTVARTLSVPNNGSASTTFTVYGRMPALQDVPAGTYLDSVEVTLSP